MDTHRVILRSLGLDPDLPAQSITHNSANDVTIIGDEFVLKLYAVGISSTIATKEAVLCGALSPAVPTPQVVAHGSDPSSGRAYLLTRVLPGQHLAAYWERLGADKQADLCRQLGFFLGSIHTAGSQIMHEVVPDQSPAVDRIDRILAPVTSQCLLTEAQASRIRNYLATHLPDIAGPAALLHGCYRLTNIIGQDAVVSGIVDWEDAAFGDPHEELALTLYRTIPEPLQIAFMNGYNDAGITGVTTSTMRAYALLYYLTYLPEIPDWGNFPGKQAYYRTETAKILKGTIG